MLRLFRHISVERREALLLGWVGLLSFSAIVFVGGLVAGGATFSHPLGVVAVAALAVAAEREGIQIGPGVEVSVASILYIFAAVTFGPLPAIVIGGVGMLAVLPRRDGTQPVLRWVTWTSIQVIAVGAASATAMAVLHSTHRDFWGLFAAVAAAFIVETLADLALTLVAPAIRGTGSWLETLPSVLPPVLASVPLQAPMVAILAYSYITISPWSVALFAIPAVAAQRLLLLYRHQRETSDALGSANERLARANLSFATALVATLDARDRYTAGHSAAVAIYARDIANRMGLSEAVQELAHLCGLVHDVGKIGLPAGLLEKAGVLTLEERRQMEQHSIIGERILAKVEDYGEIAEIVRHHHERVDGLGYPDRLVGNEIPLLSRIMAVADSYNAMTSDRPYRDAMPSRVARLRLAQAVESQFDTAVVAAFEAILAASPEEYRVGRSAVFAFETATARESELVEDLHEVAATLAFAAS